MYIKGYSEFLKESFLQHTLSNTLYHYTLTDNLESIMEEGLIPSKSLAYQKGTKGVFLTNKGSLYSTNLPGELMNVMNDFYDDDPDAPNEDRPIVRLTISLEGLDNSKFYPDDDYLANRYKWNKVDTLEKQLEESLEIWGSIVYTDIIPPSNIIKTDFNYGS